MIISGERGEQLEGLLEGSEMCAFQTVIEKAKLKTIEGKIS